MKPDEIRKLLGGYATDTLTGPEREALFTAALQDQELFNALADEQALRDYLSDAGSRRRLIEVLQPAPKRGWLTRPRRLAWAGTLAAALLVAVVVRQNLRHGQAVPVQQVKIAGEASGPPEAKQTPTEAPQAPAASSARRDGDRPAYQDEKRAKLARGNESDRYAATVPEPRVESELSANVQQARKMRLAVVSNFQTREGAAPAVTEMLGKKLDSTGDYSVVNSKDVDRALEARKLAGKPVDAPTAASIGRSLGADTVILADVGQNNAAPLKEKAEQAASREEQNVAVNALAIDTRTGENVASAQSPRSRQQQGTLGANVDQVAQSLDRQLQVRQQQKAGFRLEGLVTGVNASMLTLNLGSASVRVGDRVQVIRDGQPIGDVVITKTDATFSVGRFTGKIAARAGDQVFTEPRQ